MVIPMASAAVIQVVIATRSKSANFKIKGMRYSVLELTAITKISASEYMEELIRKHCVTAPLGAAHS
uniref:Uncharacterized protein n=1 Tax=Tolypothrix bouteillei VB521301 TaxID=1479485 RepID=A0A0C1N805_9CYAN